MMAYGIKDVDDMLDALRQGADPAGLYESYGDRIGGILAGALARMADDPELARNVCGVRALAKEAIREHFAKPERRFDGGLGGGFLTVEFEGRTYTVDLDPC